MKTKPIKVIKYRGEKLYAMPDIVRNQCDGCVLRDWIPGQDCSHRDSVKCDRNNTFILVRHPNDYEVAKVTHKLIGETS